MVIFVGVFIFFLFSSFVHYVTDDNEIEIDTVLYVAPFDLCPSLPTCCLPTVGPLSIISFTPFPSLSLVSDRITLIS